MDKKCVYIYTHTYYVHAEIINVASQIVFTRTHNNIYIYVIIRYSSGQITMVPKPELRAIFWGYLNRYFG